MNDYWNDPPEQPELPECCGEIMTDQDDGTCRCEQCGRILEQEEPDYEPEPEFAPLPDPEPLPEQACPHGLMWLDCEPCQHASELAVDAAREKGWRR